MEPLDLRRQLPRGPRETLAGLAFMPRTVDKLRAQQPGGDLGPFLNEPDGVSAYMCRRAGIDMEELRAVVASAKDEAEVESWLVARLDPAVVAETNAKLEKLGTHRLSPENLKRVQDNHPGLAERPDLQYFFDIIETDDPSALSSV
jgi:hypothetical protein